GPANGVVQTLRRECSTEHARRLAAIRLSKDRQLFAPPCGTHLQPQNRSLDGYRTDRKSTRLNSSHVKISYAVFCLKKKISSHLAGYCLAAAGEQVELGRAHYVPGDAVPALADARDQPTPAAHARQPRLFRYGYQC